MNMIKNKIKNIMNDLNSLNFENQDGRDVLIGPKYIAIEEAVIPTGVKFIRNDAFYDCIRLKKVVIPESVQQIGDNAFAGCSELEEVVIKGNIREVGARAFKGCTKLKKVIIQNNENFHRDIKLGSLCFAGCINLEKVEIGSGPRVLPYGIFYGCKQLEEFIVPETTQIIEDYAFSHSGLKVLEISPNVLDIDFSTSALQNAVNLEQVHIPLNLYPLYTKNDYFSKLQRLGVDFIEIVELEEVRDEDFSNSVEQMEM